MLSYQQHHYATTTSCLWSLDYLYGLIYRTHRVEVVEFTPIPGNAGTQMLWNNPEGFKVKSGGEYVQIKLPWLNEKEDQWHPFSVYLREETEKGWRECHDFVVNDDDHPYDHDIDEKDEGGKNLLKFTNRVLQSDFKHANHDLLDQSSPSSGTGFTFSTSLLSNHKAVRRNSPSFDTTQVFISPLGNWTKGLLKQVQGRKQLQSCWIHGPFVSPYSIVHDFSHLVLTASGIGITPALGVMAQYPGFSRTKIFVWLTRSKSMLKFFSPLLKDAHLAVVFYTGKETLTSKELSKIRSHGNIFVYTKRPDDLTGTIDSVITMFENHMSIADKETGCIFLAQDLSQVDVLHRREWCVLYCGGSKSLMDQLHDFAEGNDLGWQCESFNW